MKSFLPYYFLAALCLVVFFPAVALAAASYPDSPELVTTFSVPSSTKVPGKTLKAGTYSIRVVDHLSDRVVLQIEDAKGRSETRFLAVPNALLAHGSGTGPIPYGASHGQESLHGFAFPGGSTVEFVYPKEEAASIAKASGGSVLAIDPPSEGRPNTSKLSKEDMEMVTLWTLSPTRIGSGSTSQPAIQARRYQAKQQLPQPSTQVASVEVPTIPAREGFVNTVRSSRMPTEQASAQRVPAAKRTAVIKSLPHTASVLPLILLSGFSLLTAAAILRMLRVKFGA